MEKADAVGAADGATLDFYSQQAASYAATTGQGSVRWIDGFAERLPAGGHVLELGCGSGRDAEAFLARGFEIEPTDGVPEMAVQAEAKLGRAVKIMRFDELSAVNMYDGVWAHASLLHVPRANLVEVIAKIYRSLKPGGFHFANYKTGRGDGRDGFSRYYNYPDRDFLLATYRSSAPWKILSAEDYDGGSYGGGTTPWIAITVQKPFR